MMGLFVPARVMMGGLCLALQLEPRAMAAAATSTGAATRVAVIDVDAGVDDAQALVALLRSPEVESGELQILAITCVAGNVPAEDVVQNVRLVTAACGSTCASIPVHGGATMPLVQGYVDARYWHGQDGLGGVRKSWAADNGIELRSGDAIEAESAAVTLARLAAEHRGKLEVLALGPLTTISIVCNLFPSFAKDVRRVVVMGGTSEMIGNASAILEYNFMADPEAAASVMAPHHLGGYTKGVAEGLAKAASSAESLVAPDWSTAADLPCKLEIVPWETAMKQSLPIEWCRSEAWMGAKGCKAASLLLAAGSQILERLEGGGEDKYPSADAVAAAVFLRPSAVGKECVLRSARIETSAGLCRGAMIVDRRPGSLPAWDRVAAAGPATGATIAVAGAEDWAPESGWGACLIHTALEHDEVLRVLSESVHADTTE
jgi:inosine-uridine nucleoside N-ribohydrolase